MPQTHIQKKRRQTHVQAAVASGGVQTPGVREQYLPQGWAAAIKRDKYLYLLALPGLLFFLVFKYAPLWGLAIAFQDYSPFMGFWHSDWVGLKYFHEFFTSPDFFLLFRNTMAISLLNILFFFPLPIVLALLLNEARNLLYKKIVQTIVYLPHFLSWVVIVGICFLIFSQGSGIINNIITQAGGKPVAFLTEPNMFWLMLTAQVVGRKRAGVRSSSWLRWPASIRSCMRQHVWMALTAGSKW
ncbi:hypothetical protein [Paenibacillus sp. MBLB4367]|uniref:hypothetical protein n=1 Tax=Paenibacillus sp. MBLB4367 TaxID=3384767 RepID=UPI0039082BB4